MRNRTIVVLAICVISLLALSSLSGAAAQWFTVQSKIGGTQYGATQEIGHFRVASNGQAYNFSGSSYVISSAQNQQIGYSFSIEKIGYGGQRTVKVFERSWNGQQDSPVPLNQLRLGPGDYALLVGGRPGSSAEISFYGENVTRY
jgi:hypothetical protein